MGTYGNRKDPPKKTQKKAGPLFSRSYEKKFFQVFSVLRTTSSQLPIVPHLPQSTVLLPFFTFHSGCILLRGRA